MGGLVHERWLAPSGAAFQRLALGCCVTLTLVQMGRGVLWTWSGVTGPAVMLFGGLTLLCAWRGGVARSLVVLVILLAYTAWIAMRGW